jgi:hypothetical protein
MSKNSSLEGTLRTCTKNVQQLKSLLEKIAAHVRRDDVVPKSQNNSSVKHKKLLLMDHTIGSSRTNLQIRNEDLEIPGVFRDTEDFFFP